MRHSLQCGRSCGCVPERTECIEGKGAHYRKDPFPPVPSLRHPKTQYQRTKKIPLTEKGCSKGKEDGTVWIGSTSAHSDAKHPFAVERLSPFGKHCLHSTDSLLAFKPLSQNFSISY